MKGLQGVRPASAQASRRRLFYSLACLLFVGVHAWHCAAVDYVIDDAFISFRYVENLVRGNGLVYNAGERVEGYTNFLWIMVLAGVHWLSPRTDLLQAAQLLGVALSAGTMLLVAGFSLRFSRAAGPLRLLAPLFLAVHSGVCAWATAGLETPLFCFLVFAGVYAYVAYLETRRGFLAVPFLFALAALTRPDGVLCFVLTCAHAAFVGRKRGDKVPLVEIARWVSVFLAIYAPYCAWRMAYYGYPLPNTFYVKVGGGIRQYVRGVRYVAEYGASYGFFVFIPPALLLLRRERVRWRDYMAMLVAVYLLYIVYVGGDGLAFHRFIVFLAPMIYLLVQEGFADLYQRARSWRTPLPKWTIAAAGGLLLATSLAFGARHTLAPLLLPGRYRWYEPQCELFFPGRGEDHDYTWFDNYFVDRQMMAAAWLNAHAPSDALVASTPAGAIAYHAQFRVIDMLGLNDEHIAHTPMRNPGAGRAGHEKGDGQYVLSRNPDFVLLGNVAVLPFPLDEAAMSKKLVHRSEHELWAAPEFHERYELRCVRLAGADVFRYFTFFQRKPSPP